MTAVLEFSNEALPISAFKQTGPKVSVNLEGGPQDTSSQFRKYRKSAIHRSTSLTLSTFPTFAG